MRMPEPTMELIDVHGPYAGQSRTYTKSAGENALSSGLAVLPEAVEEVDGKAEVSRPLPDDFPARDILVDAGHTTIKAVPRSADDLMAIPGIGKGRAAQILKALED